MYPRSTQKLHGVTAMHLTLGYLDPAGHHVLSEQISCFIDSSKNSVKQDCILHFLANGVEVLFPFISQYPRNTRVL
jgi:hypothetical protein